MDVRDLRVADAVALEAALIHQPPRAHALDLLEDRPGAGMELEPGMPRAAPAQVLLHHAMHDGPVAARELERRRQHDVAAMVEDRVVVAELHVVRPHRAPLALLAQDVAPLEHLGDEHRALALGSRGQKVQILPDGSADGAGNPHVVLESRPAALHRFGDDLAHDRAALDPEPAVLVESRVTRDVADDESAKAAVAHEDVGAQAEDEIRCGGVARGQQRICQIVG